MSNHVSLAAKATILDGILPALLLVLPACSLGDGVDGDGQRTEENRDLHDFSSVSADGPLDVQVQQGDTTSVMVRVDSNLQRLVRTHVADGRLTIDVSEPIGDTVAGPHVIVTMPVLRAAWLVGSGSVSAETFRQADAIDLGLDGSGDMVFAGEVPTLTARLDGSGDMRLRGSAATVVLGLDGSGDLRAADLDAATADISLGGSGSLAATVTGPSRVTLDGSGDIDLFGGGAIEWSSVSGSGALRTH
jgi:hypothetical protein